MGHYCCRLTLKWLAQRQYATFWKNDETISQHWFDRAPKKREDQNCISCSTSHNLITREQGGQARLLKSACRTERCLIQRDPGRCGVGCPSTPESTQRQYTRDVRRVSYCLDLFIVFPKGSERLRKKQFARRRRHISTLDKVTVGTHHHTVPCRRWKRKKCGGVVCSHLCIFAKTTIHVAVFHL